MYEGENIVEDSTDCLLITHATQHVINTAFN
jgi:hypothetical protein